MTIYTMHASLFNNSILDSLADKNLGLKVRMPAHCSWNPPESLTFYRTREP